MNLYSQRLKCALVLAALAAALTTACKPPDTLTKASASTPAGEEDLRTAEVQSGDFRVSVSATGKVKAIKDVDVLSKASGEIIELPRETGDFVKKGDLLIRLDPDDENRNVSRSEAALQSAKARLEKARSELELARSSNKRSVADAEASVRAAESRVAETDARYERQQQLFSKKLVSKEELDGALTAKEQARSDQAKFKAVLEDTRSLPFQIATKDQDVKLAEVEVANQSIALEEARERLADTQILATMDGVLTERKVEKGQVIASAISVVGGTKLMVLSDLSRLFIVTSVDETDIGGIKVGQKALITTDSFPKEEFSGSVYHISPIGVELKSVVAFDVKVEVQGDGLSKLKPGMTANVTIIENESAKTFWAQSEAIQSGPEGDFVEILEDEGGPQKVPVKVGITDGLRTEIKEGVKAGQRVVLREKEGLSAWERGEGVYRPMKDEKPGFFGRRKKTNEKKSSEKKIEKKAEEKPRAEQEKASPHTSAGQPD